MKKQSKTLFAKFSSIELAGLTKQVKETIASGFEAPAPRIFTAADLWNIHRHTKARVQRRHL